MTGWKWANFAILAAGIGYLWVKQVGPFYAARSAEIRKGIEEAQKLRADADARAAAMDAKLANLSRKWKTCGKAAREKPRRKTTASARRPSASWPRLPLTPTTISPPR